MMAVALHPLILSWIVQHAAQALQRFHLWRGDGTSYCGRHGTTHKGTTLEIDERCLASNLEKEGANSRIHARVANCQLRFEKGVCLGKQRRAPNTWLRSLRMTEAESFRDAEP